MKYEFGHADPEDATTLTDKLEPFYQELRNKLVGSLALQGADYTSLVAEEDASQGHNEAVMATLKLLPKQIIDTKYIGKKCRPFIKDARFETNDELHAQGVIQSTLWVYGEVYRKNRYYDHTLPFYIVGSNENHGLLLASPRAILPNAKDFSEVSDLSRDYYEGKNHDFEQTYTYRPHGRWPMRSFNKMLRERQRPIDGDLMRSMFNAQQRVLIIDEENPAIMEGRDELIVENGNKISTEHMVKFNVIEHLSTLAVQFGVVNQFINVLEEIDATNSKRNVPKQAEPTQQTN